MKSRDFHSKNPEGNKFYAKCAGGCFEINKVVHWCSGIKNVEADREKVLDVCGGKEVCSFTPAPSFFGPKDCNGIKKTWITVTCIGGKLTTNHKDG